MSTYVSRYIEVKNKEGKWELLKFYFPFNGQHFYEPDIMMDGKPFMYFNNTCNNACSLREYLTSRRHSWKDYNFGDRGFPTDISDELKEYFRKKFETPKDGETECDYRYNKSYIYLNELYDTYIKEKDKLFNSFLKRLKEYEYEKIHKKLDRLLQVSSLMMGDLTEDEKNKEKKKTDKLLKNKKNQDDDENYVSLEEELEEFDEWFNEIQSLNDEYVYTWRLVSEIFGYKDDSEIRIVYYFD